MKTTYFLSGYYGFGNAGDEAVLAAILEALGGATRAEQAHFIVASGNPSGTVSRYDGSEYSRADNGRTSGAKVRAVPRQSPRELAAAIRACDVFVSGGGSLLQDVTSLRNVVYYTSLIRFAQLSRKPIAIYAQGVGPLQKPISQRLARAAVQLARVITVRDEASKTLLQNIGVTRAIEVTADPVWALKPSVRAASTRQPIAVALRPFPGYAFDQTHTASVKTALHATKSNANTHLRFVPMQSESDAPIAHLLQEDVDEIVNTQDVHPRDIMAACGGASAMIAMRLHALIFAAAQGVPCVAINYDPKVEALAQLIQAPLLPDLDEESLRQLPRVLAEARPLSTTKLLAFQESARRTAQLVADLAP
jgi:polysaccharide pyruvyl transferase CsaB